MSWIGRGLEDVPGRPFGWAWHQERDEIRAHLLRRPERFEGDGFAAMRLEFRVNAIQRRLHRNRPTMRERQAAARARQAPRPPALAFERVELERLAELFADANDPVTASIGRKAAAMLEALAPGADAAI